jgi:hypothetical protein
MPRLLAALLLAVALSTPARAASGITLELVTNEYGVLFVIASDAPHDLYIQIDGAGGARIQSPTVYTYAIGADEGFARNIEAYGPGSVRVRVWTNTGNAPDADATYQLPTHRYYLALAHA